MLLSSSSRGCAAVLAIVTCGAFASNADARGNVSRRAHASRAVVTPVIAREGEIARAPSHREPRAAFKAWLSARTPQNTDVIDEEGKPLGLVYTTKKDDTLASIAKAFVGLSETYLWDDFAKEIAKANPEARGTIKEGTPITIPNVIHAPFKTGDDARLGFDEKSVRGLYMRGDVGGGRRFTKILDQMAAHGMNAIVLDTKDTDGLLTYPSKLPLVAETEAAKGAPIADLARTIRFAHDRGIRVIMRLSCFHDEWMQHHKGKEMSIRGKWGGIYPIGWLDPANELAHRYIIDLAKEAMDAGADEIELDYVRYPVIGIKNADFKLDALGKTKTEVIRDFVHDVHAVTRARHVPLSLDIFGVSAGGNRVDIDMLGQDIALLGPECEALSPMVYPSHYAKGYMGFDVPGNHPELVGIGTKGAVEQLAAAHVTTGTAVRPWVQAMYYESPDYSPHYLAQELKSAVDHGSSGWLMWNPQQEYSFAWQILPRVKPLSPAPAASTSNAARVPHDDDDVMQRVANKR